MSNLTGVINVVTSAEYGFKAFSHEKAVLEEKHSITHMLFPPYTGFVRRLINIVVRVLG